MEEKQRVREGDVMAKGKRLLLLLLAVKRHEKVKKCRWPPGTGKGKETLFLRVPRRECRSSDSGTSDQ